MSNTLEYYIQKDETRATKKETTTPEYPRLIRKMKKKRKLFYYYRLKSERMAEIYKEYYKKNETTVPRHLVPKHRPEETKQEYQLRVEHAKEKLKQEIQILESRRDSYEKKTKIMDDEIDTMIKTKYDKHPMKEDYFRNKWIVDCKMEELKSNQMWQAKEAYVRSKMCTLKTNANGGSIHPKRKRQKLTKAESRQMKNTDCEMLNDSIEIKRRELEKEYIKEFEKKMHAEERGEAFDELILEQIGRKIEELEAALENINKEEEDYTIEKGKNSNRTHDNKNYKIDNIIFSRANYKTKIPLPIGKVIKARRRLDLSSYENDFHYVL